MRSTVYHIKLINCLFLCVFNGFVVFSQTKVKTIHLEKGIENHKSISLSELAADIQYIPLETNSNCLLGDSPRIQLSENEIFVATQMEHLFRFSKKGKFLNEVGKMGRGPGEFTKVINYILNNESKKVIINDTPFGNKVIAYDFEGKFIAEFKVDIHSMCIEPFETDNIFLHNMYYTKLEKGKKTNEIEIFSKSGKKIGTFPSSADPAKKYGISFIPPSGYNYMGELHYKPAESETLFTIPDVKTKLPKYFFDLGKFKRPNEADEFRNRKTQNTVAIMDLWETANYLFFTCTGKEQRQKLLYYKNSEESCNVVWKGKTGIKDDIAGGLPFWPYLFSDTNNKKQLVDFVFPYELKEHLKTEYFKEMCKSSVRAKKLKELVDNVNEFDNIIIRVVTLKN